jgi:hypothetical protein
VIAALVLLMLAPLLYALRVIVAHKIKLAARSENPSGCRTARHRIYRQRSPSAFAGPAAAMVEHLDTLGGQQ